MLANLMPPLMLSDYTKYRLYEIIPGLLIWGVLILGLVLCFVKPLWMIYFIIVFDIYWVWRVLYFSIYLTISIRRHRQALKTDWFAKLKKYHPQWSEYVHCVFLPVYNEDESVVRTSLDGLINSSFPSKRMIVVLAGEQRKHDHFVSFADKLQKEYGDKFFHFLITEHPSDLPDEIPGKGSNIHYAGHQVKAYIDEQKFEYGKVIVS